MALDKISLKNTILYFHRPIEVTAARNLAKVIPGLVSASKEDTETRETLEIITYHIYTSLRGEVNTQSKKIRDKVSVALDNSLLPKQLEVKSQM